MIATLAAITSAADLRLARYRTAARHLSPRVVRPGVYAFCSSSGIVDIARRIPAGWSCTCPEYSRFGACPHLAAVALLADDLPPAA